MAYVDDKRIYELQQSFSNFLSSFFAADKDGNVAAVKFSGQQILDFIQASPVFPTALAGNSNPDNALGSNGDLYFRVPEDGSALQLFQKISDVWASVFNLPLKQIVEASFTNVEVSLDGNITYTPPTGKTVVGAKISQVVSTVEIDKNLFPTYQDGIVYGFEKLTGGDTQTIILKIG